MPQAQIVDPRHQILIRQARYASRIHQRVQLFRQGLGRRINRRRIAHVNFDKSVQRDHRIIAIQPNHLRPLKAGKARNFRADPR